ncbi:ependymin-like [Engraulis encrasicolus]|uniref:ependymin-like n=1 Tax=Engraulis encrasicolus TaxID=184585 RepID=UPI002FD3B9CC
MDDTVGVRVLCLAVCCVALTLAAETKQPCQPPPLSSGEMAVTAARGMQAGQGPYSYDSQGKRLRFTDDESKVMKRPAYLDLLFLFQEGIFYEMNKKTSTCKKRPLLSSLHPMEVQPNMTDIGEMYLGSRVENGQGISLNNWVMVIPDYGAFVVSTSTGCLSLSSVLFTQSKDLLMFSMLDVTREVKDPAVFQPPPFCNGVPLESEGNSLFGVFLNQANAQVFTETFPKHR